MQSAIKHKLIVFALAFSLFSCGDSGSVAEDEHGHGEEAHGGHEEGGHEEGEEGVIELSKVQLANAGIQFGSLDSLNISGFVKANGNLDLPPQNIAAVSAPMDGFVKKANYLVGDYVEKGSVLAVLEHMDYIKLQEEYLNVVNNLEFLEQDFERQRQLDSAQVSSKKQFQAAGTALKSAQARKQALEKQLQYMGLSPQRVAQGEITATISIRAPFSGYITQLNVHNGSFAESSQELYELVDTDHMHLELNVFEQDVKKIKIGQPIRFEVPGASQESYKGEVFLVGKSFDPENKTVKVHGHIEGEHENFIRGLYVEARIFTGGQKVLALPEEAITEEEGMSYIFIRTEDAHGHAGEVKHAAAGAHAQEEGHKEEEHEHGHEEAHEEHAEAEEIHGTSFKRVQVVTGGKDQGFVQIKEMPNLPADAQIVTQGAYYLFSEMKKGEGGHHH